MTTAVHRSPKLLDLTSATLRRLLRARDRINFGNMKVDVNSLW